MTKRQIFETYDNLSRNELNKKRNRKIYVKNDIMNFVIKHCRGEKKEMKKKNRWIQKKLIIPESEI